MYKIVDKTELAASVKRIEIEAPEIAKKILPGQFIMLRVDEPGERIPLTVVEKNIDQGTITLIFQEIGRTTKKLAALEIGEDVLDLIGPLGHSTEIKKYGAVVAIGGGVGVAEILPVAKAYRSVGNQVIGIIGARTKELIILEKEMRSACDQLYVTTDDGSYGEKGFVSDILKRILTNHLITPACQVLVGGQSPNYPDLVYAIGPLPMMKVVTEVTRPYQIKTIVSLNPIMVDGTGMCGSCRLEVGGETKLGCCDGPEFDGHLVNWDLIILRNKRFLEEEKKALDR
ncbi:MAG TPA: sulfide/dihydroorotate dehydrogenase-like FAD/NAD-binding protein [Elusimicrobia bacterium]|jgi:ferredoxin--NADP+ reductase|nr:sulfide/dihydroorotate dehydrogenase-like FAD/NAD-binding protein [Elusimicrobiota bacterium]